MTDRIVVVCVSRAQLGPMRALLESYAACVEDAATIPVHLVAASRDIDLVAALASDFARLEVRVHAFETLLERAGSRVVVENVGGTVGRSTYEALARLYALRVLEYDHALTLDADALFVKRIGLAAAFDAFFADPYVLHFDGSAWGERWIGSTPDAVARNACKLIGCPSATARFAENVGRFYERRVVVDLFAARSDDFATSVQDGLARDARLDDAQLIYAFVVAHPERYSYRVASITDLLGEYLGPAGYTAFVGGLAGCQTVSGVLDALPYLLTDSNQAEFERLFTERQFRFFRYDARDLNGAEQRRFIERTPVACLVAAHGYRPERIALCISGLARNARQNARFLRNFAADVDADVFFHFWETPDREYLVRALRPKAHVFEPVSKAPAPPQYSRQEKLLPPQRTRDNASMLYSIMRANEIKCGYEQAHGFRYDIVVRLRLDLFTTQTLRDVLDDIAAHGAGWDRVVYVPDMMQSSGINDQFALGSSDTMDVYASTLHTLPRIAAEDWFNPEYLLLRHLLRNGIEVRTFPFEYVLLRGDAVRTFDLPAQVARTFSTSWAMPLPEIAPGNVTAYLDAQATSAALIDELDADLPRVFRIRSESRGYLCYVPAARALRFVPTASDATLFYVVIPPDEDRNAVNIRPRELVQAAAAPGAAAAAFDCFYPEPDGTIRPDGPADEDSAFLVSRRGSGVLFEWRPGFWKSPADDRGAKPRIPGGRTEPLPEDAVRGCRLVLQPSTSGVALAPLTDASEPFQLEPVRDAAAESVSLGLRFDAPGRIAIKRESLPVRALRLTYLAARLLEQRGVGVVTETTRNYLRKQARAAEQTNARGVWSAVVRRLATRL